MMKAIVILCMLFWFVCAHGQSTPPVSFIYDKDGNMEARYVVPPKSVGTAYSETGEQMKQAEDVVSVMFGEQKISIYPNPTTGKITLGVTLLSSQQKNFLRLYDVLGRLQLTVEIQQELTPVEIKGPAGIYLLDIYLGDFVSKWKIIKE